MLTIDQSQYIDDKTGRTIVRFTPVLHTDCCASGELRFACWEVWADDSIQVQTDACKLAMQNAREVLKRYSDES